MLTGAIEQDLKFYLSDYFSHIDATFHVQGQELNHSEVFSDNGMLPVLIYQTNQIATDYLNKHYPHPDFYFAIDFIIDKTALCEVIASGRHNCTDMHMYKEIFLHVLATLLKSMQFTYEGKKVYLDSRYDCWFRAVQNNEFKLRQNTARAAQTEEVSSELTNGVKEKKQGVGQFLDTEETLEHVYLNDTIEEDLEEELKIIEDMVIKKLEDNE